MTLTNTSLFISGSNINLGTSLTDHWISFQSHPATHYLKGFIWTAGAVSLFAAGVIGIGMCCVQVYKGRPLPTHANRNLRQVFRFSSRCFQNALYQYKEVKQKHEIILL